MLSLLFLFLSAGWASSSNWLLEQPRRQLRDHTYADITVHRTHHLHLNLRLDMVTESLSGYVRIDYVRLGRFVYNEYGDVLVLDIGPEISVAKVTTGEGRELHHQVVCGGDNVLECALLITEDDTELGAKSVRVYYSTGSKSSALNFIQKEQTAGDKYLVVVTQPSNARGWIPCQDTSALKHTYTAEITLTDPSWTVLMSAIDTTPDSGSELRTFRQDFPITPYLIGITVARLVRLRVTEPAEGGLVPINVWAEQAVMDAMKDAFSLPLKKLMEACQELLGPYPYSEYNVVIAPYGYTFLGMEYPLMNYITASSLATGSRKHPNYIFFDVVAHELVHTWFGNLVTYRYIADSWLTEGITSFYQKRVLGAAFEDPAITEYYLKAKATSLQSYVSRGSRSWTVLVTPVDNSRHPIVGLSLLKYSKGARVMEYLADQLGEEMLDGIARGYLSHFANQSVSTEDFLVVVEVPDVLGYEQRMELSRMLRQGSSRVRGLKRYNSTIYDQTKKMLRGVASAGQLPLNLNQLAAAWSRGEEVEGFDPRYLRIQLEMLLRLMSSELSSRVISAKNYKKWLALTTRMDQKLKLTDLHDTDPEIFGQWAVLAAQLNYQPVLELLPEFVRKHGRAGMVLPILHAISDNTDVAIEIAQVLEEQYDLGAYPGFIGENLAAFIKYYLSYKTSE